MEMEEDDDVDDREERAQQHVSLTVSGIYHWVNRVGAGSIVSPNEPHWNMVKMPFLDRTSLWVPKPVCRFDGNGSFEPVHDFASVAPTANYPLTSGKVGGGGDGPKALVLSSGIGGTTTTAVGTGGGRIQKKRMMPRHKPRDGVWRVGRWP